MRATSLIVFFAAFFVIIPAVFAQDESVDSEASVSDSAGEESTISAEEIVITATRRKSSWKDAPGMVTVISKEELQNAPELALDEFLRREPGIAYKRTHIAECGPGRESTLRGVPEQKRTLILVDGVPMNDGFGGSVNWSLIPKESVERIEIVRGPMSALYGSGAMGGVINIITKTPEKASETMVVGGYGSYDTFYGSVLQGGMFEKGGYQIGGKLYDTQGYMKVEDEQDYHVENFRTEWSLSGKYFYVPNAESRITFAVHAVEEDYSRGRETDNQINTTRMGSITYERETPEDVQILATLYTQDTQREVQLGAPPLYNAHDHTEYNLQNKSGETFQASFPVGKYNMFTTGVDSTFTRFEKKNEYEPTVVEDELTGETTTTDRQGKAKGKQRLISLFAQDELTLKKDRHKFMFTLGGRGDYCKSYDGWMYDSNPAPNPAIDEEYDDKLWLSFNPKAGFVYRFADITTMRLSVGRAFAAPTLSELYMVFSRGPIVVNGNPELDPETAISYEAGIDQWIQKNLLIRLAGYYTLGNDFINTRTIAENVFEFDNVAKVQLAGLDSELRWDIAKSLSLYGGYTYSESKVLEDDTAPETEDNDLPFIPRHKGRAGFTFNHPKIFTLDLSAKFIGARYTDLENADETVLEGYTSLDASLSRKIGENVTATVSGENLLDEQYDVCSIPNEESFAPGLRVNGQIALNF